MARKKPSPTVRPDGLAPTFREALGHDNSHPTVEALYRAELRLRDHFQRDPLRAKVKRDPLAALGLISAALAFLLWAWPAQNTERCCRPELFTDSRLPAVGAFLALSFILLLLRRR